MNYRLLHYLGESLGSSIHSGLIYFFLAYQIVISVLVFLFDSGFPPWLVVVGWGLLLFVLAAKVIRRQQTDKQEEKACRQRDQLHLQRISRLKELLKTDPGLQTRCRDCRYAGTADAPCRAHAEPADREFRFLSSDSRSYCLLWFRK